LSALVWGIGGLGGHVVWRGEEFVVLPDGRLKPLPSLAQRTVVGKRVWQFWR